MTKPNGNNLPATVPLDARSVRYTPLAEKEPIDLSVEVVRKHLAIRSRTGNAPGDGDIIRFMMLCKSRALNPFASDAYLVGYDSQDNGQWITKWQLLTALQAIRKRAESNPNYDGCECGVMVINVDGEIVEREGTVTLDQEELIGAWAHVYRKDRSIRERRTVKRKTFDTGKSRWAKDPEGMLVKCAEAAALRAAFPSDLGQFYVGEEFDGGPGTDETLAPVAPPALGAPPTQGIAGLKQKLETGRAHTPKPARQPEPEPEQEAIDEGEPGLNATGQALKAHKAAQDAQDIDQRGPEPDVNQDNPSAPTREELLDAEQERAREPEPAPKRGRGRPRKDQQQRAFDEPIPTYE